MERVPGKVIVRLGREHLALHGAAALSLRAVSRDLGVVSSAVYRYVEKREEPLTLLLIDAYNELGDEVDGAVAAQPATDFAGRSGAWASAVRRCVNRPAMDFSTAARYPDSVRRPIGPRCRAPGSSTP